MEWKDIAHPTDSKRSLYKDVEESLKGLKGREINGKVIYSAHEIRKVKGKIIEDYFYVNKFEPEKDEETPQSAEESP